MGPPKRKKKDVAAFSGQPAARPSCLITYEAMVAWKSSEKESCLK